MFIELDVWSSKHAKFHLRTINVNRIDEFYPDDDHTIMWISFKGDTYKFEVEQDYEKVMDLLANVSLLVNE